MHDNGVLVEVTAPVVLPVTLSEVKDFLRVEGQVDDSVIDGLLISAVKHCSDYLGKQLITATYDMVFDYFPRQIYVPLPPLQSVTSINYVDTAGVSQLLAVTEYQVDAVSTPGRIRPAYQKVWPTTRSVFNAVTVRFVAGFGLAANLIPGPVNTAIMQTVATWYDNREAIVVGTTASKLPDLVERLLDPHRAPGQGFA